MFVRAGPCAYVCVFCVRVFVCVNACVYVWHKSAKNEL